MPASEGAWRPIDAWMVAGLALLALAVKLPTLGTPAWWDEMGYLTQAAWLADRELFRVIPGTRPAAAFWGHPPGLHLAAAIPFKVFGASVALAHLVIAGFAALGAAGTFLLGRHLHDTRTGALAAILLLFSPLYLAQAGLFLADLPVAAMGVLCVYLASTKRYVAYLLLASYMVLVKETAMAIVVALAVHRVLTSDQPWRARFVDGVRHGAPLLVIGAFIALQKVVTGHAFFIFDFEFEPFAVTSAGQVVAQAGEITRWLFVEQYRWLLVLTIVADLALHPATRRSRSLTLLGLVVVMSGYAFSVIFFIPRYLLPVLPFLYLTAAAALWSLAATAGRRRALVVAVPVFVAWTHLREPVHGPSEVNLHYLRAVGLHAAMVRVIAERHANARILTEWPDGNMLGSALQGYVDRPAQVVWFRPGQPVPESDLVLVSSPANERMRVLESVASRAGWPLMHRLEDGPFRVALYARSPSVAP